MYQGYLLSLLLRRQLAFDRVRKLKYRVCLAMLPGFSGLFVLLLSLALIIRHVGRLCIKASISNLLD